MVTVRKLKNDLIASELSSLSFNSSERAEQSFVIRYPNIVIKSLGGNLGISPNYFQLWNSLRVISVADRDRKWKKLFKSRFSVALLNSLADFPTEIHFSYEKTDHVNGPNIRENWSYNKCFAGFSLALDRGGCVRTPILVQ